jgi:lysophospholipase L1-like esterase
MIRGVVGQHGRTRLFDLHDAVVAARREDARAPLTIDGVHLSRRGAEVVAAAFAVLVEELRAEGEPGDRR